MLYIIGILSPQGNIVDGVTADALGLEKVSKSTGNILRHKSNMCYESNSFTTWTEEILESITLLFRGRIKSNSIA